MQNDYNNKQKQDTADKADEFVESAGQQMEQKGKDVASDAQKMLKEGREEIDTAIATVDKQVHEKPWSIIAGVAIGSFILGCLMGKSK